MTARCVNKRQTTAMATTHSGPEKKELGLEAQIPDPRFKNPIPRTGNPEPDAWTTASSAVTGHRAQDLRQSRKLLTDDPAMICHNFRGIKCCAEWNHLIVVTPLK